MALRVRRGTDAERLTITPALGELIYVTDTEKLFVGDGTTVGGNAIGPQLTDIVDDGTPQLGGNLDLNGNNIVGNGNINITGNMTASGNITANGQITLGDGTEDTLSVGGLIDSNLIPSSDEAFNLGSSSARWGNAWVSSLHLSGQLDAEAVNANIIADDSSVSYDSATGVFTGDVTGDVTGDLTGNVIGNVTGNVTGDLVGSVFADDSTIMVDGISGNFTGNELNIETITSTTDGLITAGAFTAKNFNAQGQGQIVLRREIAGDQTNSPAPYGAIQFDINDDNGQSNAKSVIQAGRRFIRLVNDANDVDAGTTPSTASMTWYDNKLLVGARTTSDAEILQVNGDAKVEGYIANDQIKIEGNQITTTESNANLELTANGSGTIELTVPVQTTVGAAGSAAALPAQPSTYFKINVAGTEYVVPAYAVS